MARSFATLPPAIFFILFAATLPAFGEDLDPIASPAGGSLATITPEAGRRLGELDAASAAKRKR